MTSPLNQNQDNRIIMVEAAQPKTTTTPTVTERVVETVKPVVSAAVEKATPVITSAI